MNAHDRAPSQLDLWIIWFPSTDLQLECGERACLRACELSGGLKTIQASWREVCLFLNEDKFKQDKRIHLWISPTTESCSHLIIVQLFPLLRFLCILHFLLYFFCIQKMFLWTKSLLVSKNPTALFQQMLLDIVILFSASQWVDMEMELQTVLECRRGPKSYPLFPKSIVVLPYSLRQLILLHQAPNSAEIYRQYYTS